MEKPSSYQRRARETISLYVDPDVREAIKDLAAATRIPQSEFLREALADLLVKYAKELRRYRRTKK